MDLKRKKIKYSDLQKWEKDKMDVGTILIA